MTPSLSASAAARRSGRCAPSTRRRPALGLALLASTIQPGATSLFELKFDQRIAIVLGNERYGRPANPRFLLKRDELLHLVAPLQVVAYEHGIVHRPKTAVVQRICAVSSEEPVDLQSGLPVAAGGALG